MSDYTQPEVLVSTDWVARHADDPGAIGWSWKTQLCDTVRRDIVSKEEIEKLLGNAGATPESTIVLYGDTNNWFAAWAFWQLKVYGHKDVRLMNGGRRKWEQEGRTLTTDIPEVKPETYHAQQPGPSLRAFLPDVQREVANGSVELVDVRSPDEFSGKILAPPGLPETCQRGGHIPGASNIPWSKAVNEEDGTFKSRDELSEIYTAAGISGTKPVITYCRIGERSSHSWFALKYLLGIENIKNYDGSWTEWGNLVGAPVETGS